MRAGKLELDPGAVMRTGLSCVHCAGRNVAARSFHRFEPRRQELDRHAGRAEPVFDPDDAPDGGEFHAQVGQFHLEIEEAIHLVFSVHLEKKPAGADVSGHRVVAVTQAQRQREALSGFCALFLEHAQQCAVRRRFGRDWFRPFF
ncbi:MAG: hypothetical protein NDJ19_10235 [Ramlibacter sp.]|nr:hypothetical protein [Ramlibacter sp.]